MGENKSRKLLFSVIASDCEWNFIRGSGAGGQKRNKTSSAVRCTHKKSKAVGYSEEERSQRQNREKAFERMANTKIFRDWVHIEVSRITGAEREVERKIDMEMLKIKVEVKQSGKWVEIDKNDPLQDDEVHPTIT